VVFVAGIVIMEVVIVMGQWLRWHCCCNGGRGGSSANSGDGAAVSTIIVVVEWNKEVT